MQYIIYFFPNSYTFCTVLNILINKRNLITCQTSRNSWACCCGCWVCKRWFRFAVFEWHFVTATFTYVFLQVTGLSFVIRPKTKTHPQQCVGGFATKTSPSSICCYPSHSWQLIWRREGNNMWLRWGCLHAATIIDCNRKYEKHSQIWKIVAMFKYCNNCNTPLSVCLHEQTKVWRVW